MWKSKKALCGVGGKINASRSNKERVPNGRDIFVEGRFRAKAYHGPFQSSKRNLKRTFEIANQG